MIGEEQMLCFIHIERAAGTTFHGILRNNYWNFIKLNPWDAWTNEEQNAFGKDDLKWLLKFTGKPRGMGGHTVRSYLDYGELCPDIRYITFLREPVSRWIAHYQYHNMKLNKNWTIDSFLAEERLNNFMTKRLAGAFDVEKAKERLEKDYLLVGLIEQFDQSLILLKKKLGDSNFNIHYERKNVTKDNTLKNQILSDDEALAKIKEHNALDLELHDYVKETLFPKMVEDYGDSFGAELEAFRTANRNYRFSTLKQKWHILYRYGYYKRIEKMGHRKFHRQQPGNEEKKE